MIDKITLKGVLPRVFAGSESEPAIASSEIWLRDSVTFERPGAYLIEAESGTGKSSLCSFIYGQRTDYRGEILFDSTPASSISIERWCELRRSALAYVPQEMLLFPELTVMENILIKNRLTDYASEAQIRSMLQQLEIDNKADSLASQLSVGQQQRVAIIRALCQPFDFLLVDEPVSHLDARNNETVARLMTGEAAVRNASIIATSVGNKLALADYTLLRL